METDTHIQYTLKFEKDQYPLMTKNYQELKEQKNGRFLHAVCSVYEAHLAKQQGLEKQTIDVHDVKHVLREEIQRIFQTELQQFLQGVPLTCASDAKESLLSSDQQRILLQNIDNW